MLQNSEGHGGETRDKLQIGDRDDNVNANPDADWSAPAGTVSQYIWRPQDALKNANDPTEDEFAYDPNHAVVMLFRAMVNYQLVTGELSDTMENALSMLRDEHPGLFSSTT